MISPRRSAEPADQNVIFSLEEAVRTPTETILVEDADRSHQPFLREAAALIDVQCSSHNGEHWTALVHHSMFPVTARVLWLRYE
jgi:hypothetical protein